MEALHRMIRIVILCIWLFGIPAAVGGCLRSVGRMGQRGDDGAGHERGGGGLLALWVSGQMLLWAGFQIVCVPFVLLKKDFNDVVCCYGALSAVLALWGIVHLCRAGYRKRRKIRVLEGGARGGGTVEGRILNRAAVIAGALLVFQLLQAVRLAYADGDDAYYVAVAGITENADTMYQKLPYTGGTTELDIRHGLAPFPIWISFLARVTSLRTVGIAHVAIPLTLIPMTYAIYYLLAKELFPGRRKKQLFFLIMTELLFLFGDYSFYTVEHFMLARSRQGKAALGSIILPMLFLLLFRMMGQLEENRKCGAAYWVLTVAVMIAGCLCSTLGAFLLCLLMGAAGACAAITYRRWKLLIPMALSCLPCVCYAVCYLLA